MATPHVAGAIALIKQANPLFTPNDIKQILSKTSIDIGYGINTQGYGRINVLKSIVPNDKFIIKAPEKVNESEYFDIQVFDNNLNPTKVWTIVLVPFHITRLGYGQSFRFIAPIIVSNKVKCVTGKIIVFKFQEGFQFEKKDIVIVNDI